MAPDRYGVNILKSTSYRLATQNFGNTYYFEGPISPSSTTTLEALVDAVVALERALHASSVTFVRGRLWSQIGTKEQNQMIIDKALSGTGNGGTSGGYDKERAFLLRIRAGNDTRGRPVYLRKWLHLQVGLIASTSVPSGAVEQTAELPQAIRTRIAQFGDDIQNIAYTPGSTWDLVAKNGRAVTGAVTAHRFLEHHQLGDAWRGV